MTNDQLHKERSPSFLRAKLPVVHDATNELPDATVVHLEAQRVEIEDGYGPLWYEHPQLGSACDVIAIPMDRPKDWPANVNSPANKIDETSLPIDPGLKVMIIGFPQGISIGPGLPVIKAGFLTSLPGYDVHLGGTFSNVGGMKDGVSLPAILLDVHSVPGMSGSPVFGEYTGIWDPSNVTSNRVTASSTIGTSRVLLGCYSSRVSSLEERSGLGICHQTEAIDEICRSKHLGSRFAKSTQQTGFSYE